MVEETKEPERIFPRTLLTGLGIAVIIYMLVAVSVVTVLTSEQIADAVGGPGAARGGPDRRAGLPDRQGLPVPGGVRGRQHRADQHADGQPAALRHGPAGRAAPQRWARCRRTRRAPYAGIIFSTLLALGLIIYVSERAESEVVINLASVTSLLLLGVFTIVNIACLVLRRDGRESMFRSPGPTPAIAALATCVPDRPVGGPRRADLPDRRRAHAHRRRALGDHLGREPRAPGQEDRLPRHRPPRVGTLRGLRTIAGAERRARTLDG